MKTKSIKSVVALLGAAVVLSTSVLAGPGPQPEFQRPKVSEQKNVIVAPSKVRKAPTTAKAIIKPEPTLTYVSGPKGFTYAYRK